MKKRLTRTGNSVALILDRPLLEEANIQVDKPVWVSEILGCFNLRWAWLQHHSAANTSTQIFSKWQPPIFFKKFKEHA